MVTGIRIGYGTNINLINCSFGGLDNCIEMKSCTNFNIINNGFFSSKNAVFLSNCYGKGSISKNYTHNVSNLISVADSKIKHPIPSISKKKEVPKIEKKEQKSNSLGKNIKFNKKIKKLLSLEAEQKFIKKNHQLAQKLRYVKANFGTLETKSILKNLLIEAI